MTPRNDDPWRETFVEEQIDISIYGLLAKGAESVNWELPASVLTEKLSDEAKEWKSQAMSRMLEWNWIQRVSPDRFIVTDLGKSADLEQTAEWLTTLFLSTASAKGGRLDVADLHWYEREHEHDCYEREDIQFPGRSYPDICRRSLEMMIERGYLIAIGENLYEVTQLGKEVHVQRGGL